MTSPFPSLSPSLVHSRVLELELQLLAAAELDDRLAAARAREHELVPALQRPNEVKSHRSCITR